MKIRTGFVSNSSTSSFIILGTLMKDADIVDLLNEDFYEEAESRGLTIVPAFGEDNKWVVGTPLAIHKDDEYLDDFEISFENLAVMKTDLAEELEITEEKISIYVGTMES